MIKPAAKVRASKLTSAERLYRKRKRLLRDLKLAVSQSDYTAWARLSDAAAAPAYLKKTLRKLLRRRYGPRCCYCKRWLLNNANAAPIEHILPRAGYARFTLHRFNLTIACVDCNSIKSDDDWGQFVGPHWRYPVEAALTFFHPRLHKYDKHIRFMRMESNSYEFVTYQGLTPQGQHLCTELLSKVVGKQNLMKNYPKLSGWLRTVGKLDAELEQVERPAFDTFRRSMESMLAGRLNDGSKIVALWDVP